MTLEDSLGYEHAVTVGALEAKQQYISYIYYSVKIISVFFSSPNLYHRKDVEKSLKSKCLTRNYKKKNILYELQHKNTSYVFINYIISLKLMNNNKKKKKVRVKYFDMRGLFSFFCVCVCGYCAFLDRGP